MDSVAALPESAQFARLQEILERGARDGVFTPLADLVSLAKDSPYPNVRYFAGKCWQKARETAAAGLEAIPAESTPSPENLDAATLIGMAENGPPRARAAAIEALARINRTTPHPRILLAITTALSDDDHRVQGSALFALESIEEGAARSVLERMLRSKSVPAVDTACHVLKHVVWDPRVRLELVAPLVSHPSGSVRQKVREIARECRGRDRLAESILESLRGPADEGIQAFAAEIAREFRAAQDIASSGTASPDPATRADPSHLEPARILDPERRNALLSTVADALVATGVGGRAAVALLSALTPIEASHPSDAHVRCLDALTRGALLFATDLPEGFDLEQFSGFASEVTTVLGDPNVRAACVPGTDLLLGRLHFLGMRTRAAIERYRAVAGGRAASRSSSARDSIAEEAYVILVRLHEEEGHRAEADACQREALERGTDPAWAEVLHADLLIGRGDNDGASRALARSKIGVGDPFFRLTEARLRLHRGDAAAARPLLRDMEAAPWWLQAEAVLLRSRCDLATQDHAGAAAVLALPVARWLRPSVADPLRERARGETTSKPTPSSRAATVEPEAPNRLLEVLLGGAPAMPISPEEVSALLAALERTGLFATLQPLYRGLHEVEGEDPKSSARRREISEQIAAAIIARGTSDREEDRFRTTTLHGLALNHHRWALEFEETRASSFAHWTLAAVLWRELATSPAFWQDFLDRFQAAPGFDAKRFRGLREERLPRQLFACCADRFREWNDSDPTRARAYMAVLRAARVSETREVAKTSAGRTDPELAAGWNAALTGLEDRALHVLIRRAEATFDASAPDGLPGDFEAALDLLKATSKTYPDNHRVVEAIVEMSCDWYDACFRLRRDDASKEEKKRWFDVMERLVADGIPFANDLESVRARLAGRAPKDWGHLLSRFWVCVGCQQIEHDVDAAIRSLERGVALDPTHPEALGLLRQVREGAGLRKAGALLDKKLYDLAIAELDKVGAGSSVFEAASGLKGVACYSKAANFNNSNRFEDAVTWVRQAIGCDPAEERYRSGLCAILVNGFTDAQNRNAAGAARRFAQDLLTDPAVDRSAIPIDVMGSLAASMNSPSGKAT